MTETNSLTIQTDASAPDPVTQHDDFAYSWRYANALAASSMVPQNFQKNPHDCFVVVQLAIELGINPLTAVQNVFMIGGRPAYTAKFAVALCNRAKVFAGPIRWKINKGEKKEDLEVTAYAPLNDGDIAEVTLSWKIAAAEGWTRNKKYSTIPEQMLRWRSAKWLIDLHCPEILLGFDVGYEEENSLRTPQKNGTVQNLEAKSGTEMSLQQAIENQRQAIEPVVITEEGVKEPKSEPAEMQATEEEKV